MESSYFEVDPERSVLVFTDLAKKWRNDYFSFQHLDPPERAYRPKNIEEGSLEHAWWLFFSGWISRQGKSAEQVFGGARTLLENQGLDLINPNLSGRFKTSDYDAIKEIVPYGIRNPERVEEWWVGCLELLHTRYNSDPRQIMLTLDFSQPVMDVRHELLSRFEEFRGIGQKIAQLTIGWFQEAPWPEDGLKWKYIRNLPVIAVDLWWMRMVYQFGLIRSFKSDVTTQISHPISEFASRICLEHSINHNDLMQAVWHLAKDYCKRARVSSRANGGSYRSICQQCPAWNHCLGIVPAHSHQEGEKKVIHAKIGWRHFRQHPRGVLLNSVFDF